MRRIRRYLIGLEPIFEGGWLHRGQRADRWDVKRELVAISLLGDVTVDLSRSHSLPAEIRIHAYAIGRDVDVIVPSGTQVAINGRLHNDHVNNNAPLVDGSACAHLLTIVGHTFLGDITVRVSGSAG
jgi:hypothetical protein